MCQELCGQARQPARKVKRQRTSGLDYPGARLRMLIGIVCSSDWAQAKILGENTVMSAPRSKRLASSRKKRVAGKPRLVPEQPTPLFPIVGIGASAGGFAAFKELLSSLKPETGMGFVLVQHLDPEHASAL